MRAHTHIHMYMCVWHIAHTHTAPLLQLPAAIYARRHRSSCRRPRCPRSSSSAYQRCYAAQASFRSVAAQSVLAAAIPGSHHLRVLASLCSRGVQPVKISEKSAT